jgi:hypothetical protein
VVLYTSVELAAAALLRAEELAQGMELRVRLVCAQIVPYPLPVEQPPVNLQYLESKLQKVSEDCSLDVQGEIVLARDMQTALKSALKPDSIVVLASRRRLWPTLWANQEESLRKECIKAGHEVVMCYAR